MKYYTVSVQATLSLDVRDVMADSEQEAIDQILGELPMDFCGTGTPMVIQHTYATQTGTDEPEGEVTDAR